MRRRASTRKGTSPRQYLPTSQMSREHSEVGRARTPSRSRARRGACADRIGASARRYSSSCSGCSRWAGSFASISSGSDSSIIGTATLYFSMAQFPRSCSRQRLLQKGNSGDVSESVGFLQIGHRSFIRSSHDGFLRPPLQIAEQTKMLSFRGTLLAEESLFLVASKPREIPHFVRNDGQNAVPKPEREAPPRWKRV